jgi:hypothetical protein
MVQITQGHRAAEQESNAQVAADDDSADVQDNTTSNHEAHWKIAS